MVKKASKENFIKITLVRSPIGYSKRQKATVQALGLNRLNQSIQQADTPVIRGMIAKVSHLVEISEESNI